MLGMHGGFMLHWLLWPKSMHYGSWLLFRHAQGPAVTCSNLPPAPSSQELCCCIPCSGPMGPGPQQPPPDVAAAAALQAEAAAAAAAVPAPEPSDDEPLYIGDDEPVLVDSSLPVDAISELLLQMALRGAGNE